MSAPKHHAAALHHVAKAESYLADAQINEVFRIVKMPELVAVANVHATLAAAHAALSNGEVTR